MTVALTATPTIALPDPTLTPLERVILDEHPVELVTRATDIENECEHGNLPFDPTLDCACWTRARTAALLGQAPMDDGCPGLDRAAAFDLSIPAIEVPGQAPDLQPAAAGPAIGASDWWEARIHNTFRQHDQEVDVHTSHNGAEPTTEPFGPTAQDIHAWYMEDDARTISDVCEHFSLSSYKVRQQFEAAGLSCKPRGGSRPTPEPQLLEIPTPVPETPIEGIAAAIVALERERDAAAARGLRCEAAIETLLELAA